MKFARDNTFFSSHWKISGPLTLIVALMMPGVGRAEDTHVSGGALLSELDAGEEFVDFTTGEVGPNAQLEVEEVNGRERITISLDDVTLEDTVRMFSQTTDANIIATSTMLADKRVTVNLTDVDWRPALRSILEIHDLELIERTPGSGIFSIRARVPDAPPPTLVQTFFLEYTTTVEVRNAIQSMLRPGSTISTFPSRNAIVIRAQESNLGEIADLLEKLDRPGRQVLIETRILELKDSASKQLGVRWDSLEALRVRAGVGPLTWTDTRSRTRDRFVDSTRQDSRSQWDRQSYDQFGGNVQSEWDRYQGTDQSERLYDHTGAEISRLGTPTYIPIPGTPLYERIQPVDPTRVVRDDYDRGRAFDLERGSRTERYRGSDHTLGFDQRWDTSDSSQRMRSDYKSAILEMDNLDVVLSALERMDGVSIISNPKMVVTSGSTNAFFSVGFREPIIELERQRGTQDSPGDVYTARLATGINTDFIRQGYLETGVDLRVIATVKTDDHIEADIRPSLRRKVGEKEVEGNRWPILSVKEIDTSFTLRSGQTVAIGGLTQAEDQKETSKVPILGSIPLLGRLFRHERDVKEQIETIIFVTLSVADPDNLTDDAGIPSDAELVHTRMLRDRVRREEFMGELREQQVEAPDLQLPIVPGEEGNVDAPTVEELQRPGGQGAALVTEVPRPRSWIDQPVPRQ